MRELHLKFVMSDDTTDTDCGSCRYKCDTWRATGCELFRVKLSKLCGNVKRCTSCVGADTSLRAKKSGE